MIVSYLENQAEQLFQQYVSFSFNISSFKCTNWVIFIQDKRKNPPKTTQFLCLFSESNNFVMTFPVAVNN